MEEETSSGFTLRDLFYAVGLLVLCITALKLARAQLTPIALALLFWFMINAVAKEFGRIPLIGKHMRQSFRLFLAITAMSYAVWQFGTAMVENATRVANETAAAEPRINTLIANIYHFLRLNDPPSVTSFFERADISQLATRAATELTSAASIASTVLLYVLFLLFDQSFFDVKLRAMIKDNEQLNFVQSSLSRIRSDTSAYLWLMTLASSLVGLSTYIILAASGIQSAGFWAMICFMLNYIPTLGSILGVSLPSIYLFSQFETFTPIFIIGAMLAAVQFFAGNVMLPRMMGERLNMSGFVVVLSLFSWGAIWGPVGMLMAIPLMSILMIMLAAFPSTRPIAILMSKNGQLSGPVITWRPKREIHSAKENNTRRYWVNRGISLPKVLSKETTNETISEPQDSIDKDNSDAAP